MSRNPPPMGFPRKWSGYLSGAVKSAKILSHLSSKNALTSNSISRNNPTSSAGDFEWLTQHVISPRESKVSIFYWERPGPPLIFRPNWGPKDQKTIFFLRPPLPPLISGCGWLPHPPSPLSEGLDPPLWHLTFLAQEGGRGNVLDPHISLTHVTVEKLKVYSRPKSVRQTSVVATLARLGPKRLTALIRKRRVAHPVRLKVKDVAVGIVTFWML